VGCFVYEIYSKNITEFPYLYTLIFDKSCHLKVNLTKNLLRYQASIKQKTLNKQQQIIKINGQN